MTQFNILDKLKLHVVRPRLPLQPNDFFTKHQRAEGRSVAFKGCANLQKQKR